MKFWMRIRTMTGAICISSPPSGGIGSPAPNSPYIPLQGSAPISSGTALEETLITKRNLPISSVFWVSNMEISLPSSRIRRRIYGNNRGRRTFPLLIHEPATASVRILTCTPPTSLSASAHAVVVAPVVSTSSTIRICFPTKRSG